MTDDEKIKELEDAIDSYRKIAIAYEFAGNTTCDWYLEVKKRLSNLNEWIAEIKSVRVSSGGEVL